MTATYGRLVYRELPVTGERLWGMRAVPHVMIRAKRIFPRARANHAGQIVVADTTDVAADLEWFTARYPLDMDDDTAARLAVQAGAYRARHEAVDDILAGRATLDLAMEPARTPREYQLVAAAMARTSRRLLIADDVGLGKTTEAALLLAEADALPALVVCQTHLPSQWVRELAATWPLLVTHSATKARPYDLTAGFRGGRGRARIPAGVTPDVVVMGYSKLAGWGHALVGQVRTVIFDEVQELRHGLDTEKGVAARLVADQADYVLGLSASPVYNYGSEVHNIFEIMAPEALGTREEFVREWGAGAAGSSGQTKVGDPAALGTFLRDQGLMLRRTRADVHRELPEPIRIRQEVRSDPEALERVRGDVAAMARLILDPATDRKQAFALSGEIDWKLRQATGIAKAPYVAEFVRMLLDSEEKVVLAGWHRATYELWLDALAEFGPRLYTGSESPTQKEAAKDAFVDGDCRVLMLSLRSGVGLDGLQKAASVVVFGELDWSPAVHDQVIGRLARDGQASTVAAYFLVCDDGSDPVMDEVLELKHQQAEPIRNPDLPLVTPLPDTGDRIKRLARAVLDGPNQRALL